MAAVFTLATTILLARGLPPATFAFVAAVQVALKTVAAINGFGLERQIQVLRARNWADELLPTLFAKRLRNTYVSVFAWLVAVICLWLITGNPLWLLVAPAALWLAAEQTTMVWNGISIVDGKAHHLVESYFCRYFPVAAALAFALWQDWNIVLTWSLALGAGSLLAYVVTLRSQEKWARMLWPPKHLTATKVERDLAFWWNKVGEQLRDFDVAVVAMISAYTGGLFALSARVVRPMNLVSSSIAAVAFPKLVRRDAVAPKQLLGGVVLGSLPTTVVAATIAAAAPLLPKIVGDEYAAAVNPARIHCLAAALFGFSALLAAYLQARSKEANRFAGRAAMMSAIAQVASAAIGAYLAGAIGASVGVAVASIGYLVALSTRSTIQSFQETRSRTAP